MELLDDNYKRADHTRTIEDLIENGYQTDAYRYIREGWELFKKNPGLFVVYTVIIALIAIALSEIRLGSLADLIVGPCLMAGWYLVARRTSLNLDSEFRHFFDGFKYWQKLVPFTIVSQIFTIIGLVFLVIPGIYLAVAYIFVIPIILFYRGDLTLMEVLEGSRKVISKKWWNLFGFVGLILLINIAGALALGVGLLVSIPTSACAVYMAYEDIFGISQDDLPA